MRWWIWSLAACGRIAFDPLSGGDGGPNGGDAFITGDGVTITTNIVFVTPQAVIPGNLGGQQGGDAACQMYAQQAGLPGTYVAFLSTSTASAISRLDGARGWSRVDGAPWADLPSDIAAGTIFTTPSVQADGTRVPILTDVVTGSNTVGGLGANTCNNFTSTSGSVEFGMATATSGSWAFQAAVNGCGSPGRIYCFGVDRTTPLTPPTYSGTARRAFVSGPWNSGGGVADADQRCQNDATTAALSGSFKALIASPTTSAASRFSSSGEPWARLDGILLAPTAAELIAGTVHEPLNRTFDGVYVAGAVRTGASSPTATTNSTTCADWTSSTTMFGQGGWLESTYGWFGAGSTQACSVTSRLFCFEE